MTGKKTFLVLFTIIFIFFPTCQQFTSQEDFKTENEINIDFDGMETITPYHNQIEDWQFRMEEDTTFSENQSK